MPDQVDRMEIRAVLAQAMGWTMISGSGFDWYCSPGGKSSREIPDPFANASDLLALLEWARNQKWFDCFMVHREGVRLSGHKVKQWANGPFQAAFPMAVYAALQGVEPDAEQ